MNLCGREIQIPSLRRAGVYSPRRTGVSCWRPGNGTHRNRSLPWSSSAKTYRYPLYAYVRRQGRSSEDAQDLTQDFFVHLLARGFPRGAAPERGKFRSFLLASLRHFLVDQHRHADAVKRGGGKLIISLDQARAEERFGLEPRHELTPERLLRTGVGNDAAGPRPVAAA